MIGGRCHDEVVTFDSDGEDLETFDSRRQISETCSGSIATDWRFASSSATCGRACSAVRPRMRSGAFYCLSGYLMTLDLEREVRLQLRSGLGRPSACNRISKRIYPAYYAVAAGHADPVSCWFLRRRSISCPYCKSQQRPAAGSSASRSCHPRSGGELVHGASALRVELWFYVMMALGLARNKPIVVTWFVASCAL